MLNFIKNKLGFKITKVPLFYVILDKEKYFKNGSKDSCYAKMHPHINLLNEETQNQIKQHINTVIDLIRDNLDVKFL